MKLKVKLTAEGRPVVGVKVDIFDSKTLIVGLTSADDGEVEFSIDGEYSNRKLRVVIDSSGFKKMDREFETGPGERTELELGLEREEKKLPIWLMALGGLVIVGVVIGLIIAFWPTPKPQPPQPQLTDDKKTDDKQTDEKKDSQEKPSKDLKIVEVRMAKFNVTGRPPARAVLVKSKEIPVTVTVKNAGNTISVEHFVYAKLSVETKNNKTLTFVGQGTKQALNAGLFITNQFKLEESAGRALEAGQSVGMLSVSLESSSGTTFYLTNKVFLNIK